MAKGRGRNRPSTTSSAAAQKPVDTATDADPRREQLVRATVEVIAERGFPETRITDVAERAGTSSALVLYYFGTKDQLLTEALRLAEDSFYDYAAGLTESITSPCERLEMLVVLCCAPGEHVDDPEPWILWLDLWAQAIRHEELGRVREQFDVRWRATFAALVADGRAAGEFANEVDPTEFALWFSALLDGLAIQVALHDPVIVPERAIELCMRLAAVHLGFEWTGRKAGVQAGAR
jgi:AcrR family transcriptional regulator